MKKAIRLPTKLIVALAISSWFFFIIFLTFFILHSLGIYTHQYSGFGIDTNGILYVGTDSGIKKYHNSEVIGEIYQQTSRGYSFTVQSDDTILLSTGYEFITMNSNGTVLIRTDVDGNTRLESEIRKSNRVFYNVNGSAYSVKHPLLRTTVYDESGKIVFQMPLLDYCFRILMIVFAIGFLIFGFWFIIRVNKLRNKVQTVLRN